MAEITDQEFSRFQRFIYEAAGITLSDAKKALVSGRLAKRLQHYKLRTYSEYLRLLTGGHQPQEVQAAVDLLTTNETYFFREPRHFEFLREQVRNDAFRSQPPRIWSAAGSTGEEAYSVGMVLEDCLPARPWEIVASDISTRVLAKARAGHYPMERARYIPPDFLRRFCLKGQDKHEGTLLVDRALRQKVRFMQVNLNAPLPQLGLFDFVFLRNVLIYFNLDTKRQVVSRVLSALKPGGWLFIGHSENLHDITEAAQPVAPAIFRKL